MDFKTALLNLQKAKTAKIQAEKNLILAESALQKARPEIKQRHDNLTDTLALAEVGEADPKQIEEATVKFEQAEKAFDQAKRNLEVAKKVIPLVNQKLESARADFQNPATDHYKDQAKPMIEQLLKTLDDFDTVYKRMQPLADEIQSNGLDPFNFLPSKIESVNFSHLKHPVRLERYRQELKELKTN